jgi:hypothetical protein
MTHRRFRESMSLYRKGTISEVDLKAELGDIGCESGSRQVDAKRREPAFR